MKWSNIQNLDNLASSFVSAYARMPILHSKIYRQIKCDYLYGCRYQLSHYFASHSELSNNCIDLYGNTQFGKILELDKVEYKEARKANITPHKKRPQNHLTAQFPILFAS